VIFLLSSNLLIIITGVLQDNKRGCLLLAVGFGGLLGPIAGPVQFHAESCMGKSKERDT